MSETRKLVAILAADVVGYSRLADAGEDCTPCRRRIHFVVDSVRHAMEELKALTERDAARQKSVNSGIVFRGPADPHDWDPSTRFTVTQAGVLARPCRR
jgi:class 3 adenylate cyclase